MKSGILERRASLFNWVDDNRKAKGLVIIQRHLGSDYAVGYATTLEMAHSIKGYLSRYRKLSGTLSIESMSELVRELNELDSRL